jgi:hypothetical protein
LFVGDGFGHKGDSLSPRGRFTEAPDPLRGGVVHESSLSTNHDSQWALNVIFALGQVPEALEDWWREQGARLWPA